MSILEKFQIAKKVKMSTFVFVKIPSKLRAFKTHEESHPNEVNFMPVLKAARTASLKK